MSTLTHLDASGRANMVDVGDKPITERVASATATLIMQPTTLALIEQNQLSKGDVLAVARVAAILAAKRCDELIPLCHSIPLASTDVVFTTDPDRGLLRIETRCIARAQTGVEMEALTAASVAALTIYDMCKSVDKSMFVRDIMLITKSGGRSGDWYRADSHPSSELAT